MKQRIIGILVILAVLIVIIPIFFGRHTTEKSEKESLEQKPSISSNQSSTSLAIPGQVNTLAPTANNATTTNNIPKPSQASDTQPLQLKIPAQATANQTPSSNIKVAPALPTAQQQPAKPMATLSTSTTASKIAQTQSVTELQRQAVMPTVKIPEAKTTAKHLRPKTSNNHTAKTITTTHKAITTTKPAYIPKAWAVQLGSFSDKINAQKLVNKLRAKGFAVYTQEVRANGHIVTKVFVGPELRRTEAEEVVRRLQRLFNIKGFIVSYSR